MGANRPVTGRLLTGREVAERLNVSPKTVLRWALDVERTELPSVRLSNRAIRFPEDQLDAWIEQRRTTPGAERVTDPAGRRPPTTLVRVTDPKGTPWREN
jgi:excisionase family DNA binding protein